MKNRIRYNVYTSKKLLGIGILLDTDPPQESRPVILTVQFILLFFSGWLVVYGKNSNTPTK